MYIQALCFAFVLPAVAVAGYYVILALTALLCSRRPQPVEQNETRGIHSFAIVIPAHNEEEALPATLASCAALDYPRDHYQVFVVADHCDDGTAAVAQQFGASCLERCDGDRGKAPALEWALPHVLAAGHDAVLVLDADCRLDRHALRAFDRELVAGRQVLQAKVVAANPDVSATSLAVAVGNHLENDFFYAPKHRLGWAVLLRGTGMVLHRDVLQSVPFRAASDVEDAEYSVRLLRAGWSVQFVADVSVSSNFPADTQELTVQRRRWTVGNFRMGRALALRLLLEGLIERRWQLADAGWTLLVAIRPLLLLELLLATVLALLTAHLFPGPFARAMLGTIGAVWLVHAAYWGLGIAHLGVTRRRLGLLWSMPLLGARLLLIFVGALFRKGPQAWARSTRGVNAPQACGRRFSRPCLEPLEARTLRPPAGAAPLAQAGSPVWPDID